MYTTLVKNQIKKFQDYLIAKKGLGDITVDGYGRSLSIALRRMRKVCPMHKEIEAYILWMHKKNYSHSYICNTSLAIEHYSEFKGKPIVLGKPRRPSRIIKNTLTENEVSRLILATKNIREKAMICILAYSGIRNRELCRLTMNDLDLAANHIRVMQGKNYKDRIVNIATECVTVLIDYCNKFPRTGGEYVLTTLVRNRQLQPGDIRKLIKTLAKRAEIVKRVYPHLLRHSLATNLLKRGANLILIKDQLGHVFIDSTMIYIKSMPMQTRTEYDFYKPAYM